MSKPREFWLDICTPFGDPCDFISEGKPCELVSDTNIHVIEKSAYDALAAKLAIAVEALKIAEEEFRDQDLYTENRVAVGLVNEALAKIRGAE